MTSTRCAPELAHLRSLGPCPYRNPSSRFLDRVVSPGGSVWYPRWVSHRGFGDEGTGYSPVWFEPPPSGG